VKKLKNLGLAAIVLAVVAGGTSYAKGGGGTSLALGDPHPTFGKKVFIALDGTAPKTTPDIALTCTQNGSGVLYDRQSATGGGDWFTLGPTAKWTSGGATCTADLLTASRKGWSVSYELIFSVAAS
jgi:hypothetical protein